MEKGIISVVGKDQIGIIAEVCGFLAKNKVNILDISQTIIEGYFNMLMIVDITNIKENFNDVGAELHALGQDIGVVITLQHENIFNKMHRI